MECGETNTRISNDQEEEEQEEEDEEEEEEEIKDEEENENSEEDDDENDIASNQIHYKCKHAVENSSRFSLRVMEAMRFLQTYKNVLPISSVKEIVDYITYNYNNDGDLYAQVCTALKQLCSHKFVVKVLKDEYQLIGPFGPSAMLEICDCNMESYNSIPKRTKLTRKHNNKTKKKSRCNSDKVTVKQELEMKTEESISSDENSTSLSRTESSNNTILEMPNDRFLRSGARCNNSNMHSISKNAMPRKRSLCENQSNTYQEQRSKRIRKIGEDVAKTSRCVEQNESAGLSSNDPKNGNICDNTFQEIKNLVPKTSKTREKELKKWIQRCYREYERQKET